MLHGRETITSKHKMDKCENFEFNESFKGFIDKFNNSNCTYIIYISYKNNLKLTRRHISIVRLKKVCKNRKKTEKT